jgi:hypothetical protein
LPKIIRLNKLNSALILLDLFLIAMLATSLNLGIILTRALKVYLLSLYKNDIRSYIRINIILTNLKSIKKGGAY